MEGYLMHKSFSINNAIIYVYFQYRLCKSFNGALITLLLVLASGQARVGCFSYAWWKVSC